MLATAAGGALLAAVALVLALGQGGSMEGRSRRALLTGIALLPLLLLAWKAGVSALYPGMTEAWPGRPGFRCLRLELLVALVPMAAAIAARRGSDPIQPATTGAALGAACGLAAAVLVDLWCPVAHLPHLLLGHLLPIVLLAVIGAVAGADYLPPRLAPRRTPPLTERE
jgi:hypothetical protein